MRRILKTHTFVPSGGGAGTLSLQLMRLRLCCLGRRVDPANPQVLTIISDINIMVKSYSIEASDYQRI